MVWLWRCDSLVGVLACKAARRILYFLATLQYIVWQVVVVAMCDSNTNRRLELTVDCRVFLAACKRCWYYCYFEVLLSEW